MSISIALTKGRLEKATVKLLEERGYGIESLKDKGRALVFQDSKKDIRYFLVKSNDCITYVQHGVADIGVVGKDTLLEGGKDYYEMLDLGIGKCKFIVAGLREHNLFDKVGHVKIGTKYPNIAKQYFLEKGMDTVCDISARVIVNKASFKLKRAEILAILEDMKKGLEAC